MKSNNLTDDVRRVGQQTISKWKLIRTKTLMLYQKIILNYISEVNILITTHKLKEKELKKIIDKDLQHHDKDKHLKLLIYYKNRKVKKLFVKN